jgi:hypothetical protein
MYLKIDKSLFMMTFGADANYHAELEGQETYLNRADGSLVYTVSDPEKVAWEIGESAVEDLLENTTLIIENPEQYLKIPSMFHDEHHAVMQGFLSSKWIEDQAVRDEATNVYYPRKSIGYWIANVGNQSAIDAYFAYREAENLRLAEIFLGENGIFDYKWK